MPQLRKLAGDCDDVISCPAVFIDEATSIDGDSAVVQGAHIVDQETLAQLNLGTGEVAVRLPAKLILDAARQLTENV